MNMIDDRRHNWTYSNEKCQGKITVTTDSRMYTNSCKLPAFTELFYEFTKILCIHDKFGIVFLCSNAWSERCTADRANTKNPKCTFKRTVLYMFRFFVFPRSAVHRSLRTLINSFSLSLCMYKLIKLKCMNKLKM